MLAALESWNLERKRRDDPVLRIGIGLNYGPAVIGDVGAGQTLSFTVIGDTVNIASRLQRLTRDLNTPLVIGGLAITAAQSADARRIVDILTRLEDRGEQLLRGRSEPVRIWIHHQEWP
jgi:adenylate cyclase